MRLFACDFLERAFNALPIFGSHTSITPFSTPIDSSNRHSLIQIHTSLETFLSNCYTLTILYTLHSFIVMASQLSRSFLREVRTQANRSALRHHSTTPISSISMRNLDAPRQCYSVQRRRRHFHSSTPSRDFHFDTHHFVQRLEREGLNRAQAEGIMTAMAEVIDESIRNMTSNMVTKADQEKVCWLLHAPKHIPDLPDPILSIYSRTECISLSFMGTYSTNTLRRSTLRSSNRRCS